MKKLLFLATVMALISSGCKNDGCNEPYAFNYEPEGTTSESCVYQPILMSINFEPYFGDNAITTDSLGGQMFETEDGRELSFSFFGIYLTEVSLRNGDEYSFIGANEAACTERVSDAFLFKNDNRTIVTQVLPEAGFSIDGLRFNVGVDSCRNLSIDPTTQTEGPFVPHNPTMYWSWASGYRFVSLNGKVDISENADGSTIQAYEYHTGLNKFLRQVELELEDMTPSGPTMTINVKVDLKQIMKGIDYTKDFSTHTFDNEALAEMISDNATTAFSIAP